MDQKELYFTNQKTEEVQNIIDRMPTRLGFWVSTIVLLLFVLMLVFGWLIRYPDVIIGQISINANVSPLKLVANTNGKLKLNGFGSLAEVKEGQVLAHIENSTNPTNVLYIDSLLKIYNPNDILNIRKKLPINLSLGELNIKYYTFANALRELSDYKEDRLIEKQTENLFTLLQEQKNAISNTNKRIEMAKNSLAYTRKFYNRDSALFSKKVISESELDKAQMGYLSSKDALQNAISNLINAKQVAQQTESKIQELSVQKPEKYKELQIALISAYNDLKDNIKNWEQRYLFKAPFNGKIQFLKFYNENQFVQAGEQIFTIVPNEKRAFGQVVLLAQGSGKVKVGQEVIIKLDNYPYLEYGSLTGYVKSISLTTNTTKTEKSEVETYMVLVDFPSQLKTNYGTKLEFRAEARGTAEIITNDRRLIQRLFDNLKYVINK